MQIVIESAKTRSGPGITYCIVQRASDITYEYRESYHVEMVTVSLELACRPACILTGPGVEVVCPCSTCCDVDNSRNRFLQEVDRWYCGVR